MTTTSSKRKRYRPGKNLVKAGKKVPVNSKKQTTENEHFTLDNIDIHGLFTTKLPFFR